MVVIIPLNRFQSAYFREVVGFFRGDYIGAYLGVLIGFTVQWSHCMIFLLALKVFDMFYKMELIKKVFIEKEVSAEIGQMLEWKIPPSFMLMGVVMYPPLLFYALM